MTPKERFDALMGIADFHLQRVQSRNTTEWRLAFSAWALIVAAIATVKQRPSDLVLGMLVGSYCITLIIILTAIYRQNAYQATRAYYYLEKAESVLEDVPFDKQVPKSWHSLTLKEKFELSPIFTGNVVLMQSCITLCLGLACYVLLGQVEPLAPSSTAP
jgi:hypothetical protein